MQKSNIKFFGGAEHVTGANFVLETGSQKIMLDCGLIQGGKFSSAKNAKAFPYNPSDIDFLFVSHTHMDHIGRIPKLVKEGFKGKIISTPATKDIAPLMFEDAHKIMLQEEKITKIPPIYDMFDVKKTMTLWDAMDYYEEFDTGKLKISFKNAGHILGSAMVFIDKESKRFVYTGDLGNTDDPLLKPRDKIKNADFMIIESVYGDREHEGKEYRTQVLKKIIQEAQEFNKTILIPSFSLERAQVILYEINKLVEDGEIEPIKVFLDSPLAIKLTSLFYKHRQLFNESVQKRINLGDDIFNFPYFKIVETQEQSQEIAKEKGAKIIIAGSGMSTGGRVLSHEQRLLQDENAIIVFVGYQAAGTLGRQIQEGIKKLKIANSFVKVRARVYTIKGFSAHADREELLSAVSESADTLQNVFVVMGELKSSLFLSQRIREYLGVKSTVPNLNSEYEIDF